MEIDLKFHGKPVRPVLTWLIMIIGVKSILKFLWSRVLRGVWTALHGSWIGSIGPGSGMVGTIIEQSSIFNDNWPSMKQIFRTILRYKIKLLDAD